MYLFLALGLKSRDPAAAQQAFQTAMQGIDRLMKEGVEYSRHAAGREVLLPLVEQIDPALVPEYFWRVVATRPSARRSTLARRYSARSRWLSFWPGTTATWPRPCLNPFEPGWNTPTTGAGPLVGRVSGLVDLRPRAAVARLEQVPVDPKLELNADRARREVFRNARARPRGALAKGSGAHFTEMGDLFERDLR